MGLFGLFGGSEKKKKVSSGKKPKFFSELDDEIKNIFPTLPEPRRIEIACVAGLMAKMIIIDGHVDEREKQSMVESMVTWMKLSTRQSRLIMKISIEKMDVLGKVDADNYAAPLIDSVTHMRRFELLMALCGVAAADEEVDPSEIAELKKITKALHLENNDYVAALDTVSKYIKGGPVD